MRLVRPPRAAECNPEVNRFSACVQALWPVCASSRVDVVGERLISAERCMQADSSDRHIGQNPRACGFHPHPSRRVMPVLPRNPGMNHRAMGWLPQRADCRDHTPADSGVAHKLKSIGFPRPAGAVPGSRACGRHGRPHPAAPQRLRRADIALRDSARCETQHMRPSLAQP